MAPNNHNNASSSSSSSKQQSSTSIAQTRLQSINGHMAQSQTTSFPADAVPQAPEDPLFGLMAAYRADTFDKKVDLGIGAYRDNNAKPWVLPVVKKVDSPSIQSSLLPREYRANVISSRPTKSFAMTPRDRKSTRLNSSHWE